MLVSVLAVMVLLLASAFFSATETAYTSLSPDQLHDLANGPGKAGRRAAKLSRKPTIVLTTILIGNNLANIGAAALVTLLTEHYIGTPYVSAASGILTLVVLIFCEVSPKRIAMAHNSRIAGLTSYPLTLLGVLLRPFVLLITSISTFITRLFTKGAAPNLSLAKILNMISAGESAGVVKEYEGRMVKRIFHLDDIPVQTIMTHRTDVFSLSATSTIAEVADSVVREGYSRVPVYERDPENIVGVVLAKDMLEAFAHGRQEMSLRSIMKTPIYVPDQRKANEVFAQFQGQRMKIAVVQDEYGGFAGIVSLEDIAEEVFGEIYDETDAETYQTIVRDGPREFSIVADTSLPMIHDALGVMLPGGRADQTLGAYLLELLQRIPKQGEAIEIPGFRLVVETMDENRIDSVRLIRRHLPTGSAKET